MNDGRSWLRSNWRTAVALLVVFVIALFLRFYFVYGLAFPDGLFSGGSDSYYWERALRYSFETGKDLGWDSLLNYPIGLPNPRPPLFPWFSLLLGEALAPLFGDAWASITFVLLASTGLFGALTVFPTYLLGKEAFGRRAGLVAAFLLAVSAAHLQRSQATDADHDAFTLFFVVCTFYFYLRALRSMQSRRWVENWSSRASMRTGIRAFFAENRKSVLYALLAGLCITAIALSWQGWAYVPVILIVYFVAELFLDRVRNQDTMGVSIVFGIVLLTPLVLALPWYAARGQIRVWFDVPGYLFVVAVVLGGVFTVTRDYPWTIVIPSTFAAGGAGLGVGVLVNPALAQAFVSGAGYFVQTKVYETIAEAQAPGLSQLILSFGWFTFYFSLGALVYMIWQTPRRREPAFTMIVVWAFASIFMAMAAARFIFNASPAFAVAAAYAIDQVLLRADFQGLRRSYRSLAEGSWRNAIRKSVKLRHVGTVLVLAGLVVLPNVWYGVDAAMPFEVKTSYDRQVHDALPFFLRSPGYEQMAGRGTFYFGAFGYSLPQDNEYFPAAWRWFRTQDADVPAEQRPAFLSWWDYGFEAVDQGQHPAVADNFQDGFAFAGQFITAQSEAHGIALLSVRLLEGDVRNHRSQFSPGARTTLEAFALPADEFLRAYVRPSDFIAVVKGNPTIYGVWDQEIQPLNALYIYLAKQLTGRFDTERLVDLYRALRAATDTDIGYFVVDSRLFPISASNTGIFYAPVKLSDHPVLELADGRTLPTTFFQVMVDVGRGQNIPIQNIRPDDQVRSQTIEYQTEFYRSMFYRTYIGYSPADLGSSDKGIPGFSQALRDSPPNPAWNLSHFRVVYRTGYHNPFADHANHTDAWSAMNYDEAQRIQADINTGKATGVVDASTSSSVTNGLVFVRYYDGAWVNGTVLAGDVPVPGVRITVTDELGTPHYVTTTDAAGRYSALVPFGTVTLTASVGATVPRTLVGAGVLKSLTLPITVNQAMREDEDLDADGRPDWLLTRDIVVGSRTIHGRAFFDLDRDATFGTEDDAAARAMITLVHSSIPFERTATASAEGTFTIGPLLDGRYRARVSMGGRTVSAADVDVTASSGTAKDILVPHGEIRGITIDARGTPLGGAVVTIHDEANGTEWSATTHADGRFSFEPLLRGNYTLVAESGELAAQPSRTVADVRDVWQNLTLVTSGRVAGITRLFGTDRPYATIAFQSAADPNVIRSVTSDAAGAFALALPVGDWNVNGRLYAGTTLYATLGRVQVVANRTISYSPVFVDGVRVNGTVTGPGMTFRDARTTLAFLSPSGDWWLRTGTGGGYVVFLPPGPYDVQVTTPTSAFYGTATVRAGQPLNFQLENATIHRTSAYRDANGNDVLDVGEGVGSARLELVDGVGRRLVAVSNGTGGIAVLGFDGQTYSGRIAARGFENRAIGPVSLSRLESDGPYALSPMRVTVAGSLLLDGAPILGRTISVQAVPSDATARAASGATDSNGGYLLELVPGTYDLVVDANVSGSSSRKFQNAGTDRIAIRVGDGFVAVDLDIVVRNRVAGFVLLDGAPAEASLTFDGPDRRDLSSTSAGYETYLRDGAYSVRASRTSSPDVFAALDTISVSGPADASFALERAATVTGAIRHLGAPLAQPTLVTFTRDTGGSSVVTGTPEGRYTEYLVPGTYAITVDSPSSENVAGATRFYRFTLTDTVNVPSGSVSLTKDLDLVRILDNTSVSGSVTWLGLGTDATVRFLSRDAGALDATTRSAPTGAYGLGLAPGTYDVHATFDAGGAAFLDQVIVSHATSQTLDLVLEVAHRVSGVITDPSGARVAADVTLEADSRLSLTTGGSGSFAFLVPEATYALRASRSGTELGIVVQYHAETSIDLRSEVVANLRVEKVVRREVSLSWDASQRVTIAAGGSAMYTFDVRNDGNVADTYVLSGEHAGWTFAFTPASVALDYGVTGSRTSVSVTITSPKDAPVVHGLVPVIATSTTDPGTQGTLGLELLIQRYRGLDLRVNATTGVFDGRYLNLTVEIKNAGNADESVSVGIANPDDLAASGWSARLARESAVATSTEVRDVSVPANTTVKLRLQLQSTGGTGGAVVIVQATALDTPLLTDTAIHTFQLPSLGLTTGIGVRGPNIARDPTLSMPLVTILVSAAAAIGLALFLTRRRR